jgi:hypothetical protein
MKNDRYYKTTNLNLATFLYVNDQMISGITSLDEKRKEFVFLRSDFLEELAWLWKFGQRNDKRLLVFVPKYEQARTDLINRLKD